MEMMKCVHGFADRLRVLQGWKSYAVAFVLGVCFTAACPPFWALPLAIMAFTGWVWLLQGATTAKQAFKVSWWFGFGHHTTGLYWICIALGVDGSTFLWLMPFALCLLPAYLSLFIGLAGAAWHGLRRTPVEKVLCLAVLWVVAEYIRANLFYGFPWNLAGYIWTVSDVSLQPAAIVGIYGLSLWAVLFCAAFSLLAQPGRRWQKQANYGFMGLMLLTLIVLGWGQARLAFSDNNLNAPTGIKLRLVQANVEQSLKWDPQFQMQALERHINFSRRAPADGIWPNYIIWPETAMPFRIEEDAHWTQILAGIAPLKGALITGVVRSMGQGDDWEVWNSMRAIDRKGDIIASYDKTVLVPFGEFIPLRSVLAFLPIEKVTQGTKDFSRGTGAQALEMADTLPMQPLICYEAIFSDYRSAEPAGWLLNITNDAWFGTSTGPYQHLHMARTRAVERGIPMVRAANTGVSAVFDAYGRLMGKIALNQQGVLDVPLPPARLVPTWYSQYGEFTLIIICYILLIYIFRVQSKID